MADKHVAYLESKGLPTEGMKQLAFQIVDYHVEIDL